MSPGWRRPRDITLIIRVGWGYLEVELTTHATGGLSRNDFVLAAKIDALDG